MWDPEASAASGSEGRDLRLHVEIKPCPKGKYCRHLLSLEPSTLNPEQIWRLNTVDSVDTC